MMLRRTAKALWTMENVQLRRDLQIEPLRKHLRRLARSEEEISLRGDLELGDVSKRSESFSSCCCNVTVYADETAVYAVCRNELLTRFPNGCYARDLTVVGRIAPPSTYPFRPASTNIMSSMDWTGHGVTLTECLGLMLDPRISLRQYLRQIRRKVLPPKKFSASILGQKQLSGSAVIRSRVLLNILLWVCGLNQVAEMTHQSPENTPQHDAVGLRTEPGRGDDASIS
ncbi:hypothetical protein QE152_g29203 [Popillia japonica]|uniref:Uncharacterized protein n=1 Tax=Popillia japonica TaxID=7064 RepID=A0AAW1JJU9_POPJA